MRKRQWKAVAITGWVSCKTEELASKRSQVCLIYCDKNSKEQNNNAVLIYTKVESTRETVAG